MPARSADNGKATQNGQLQSLVSNAVVIAPMNMNPAWPNEISPVIPSSHMLTAIITLMPITIITCRKYCVVHEQRHRQQRYDQHDQSDASLYEHDGTSHHGSA